MRVWIPDKNEYYYSGEGNEQLSIFFGVLAGYEKKGIKFTLERPTGVFSREAKEIFEGDRVQILYLNRPFDLGLGKHSTRVGNVVFDSGCFLVYDQNDNYYEYVGAGVANECFINIIGNIHESRKS